MKRKFLLIATAVFVMASCTNQQEGVETSQESLWVSDAIGFRTNTTRATILYLSDMQSSTLGFDVYATSGDGAAWYLDGSNSYVYTSSAEAWGWSQGSETWPEDESDYSLTFYALYAEDYQGIAIDDSDLSTLTADVDIQDVDNQVDILATTATASARPSDGKLSLAFDHILSKVDFGVVVGYEMSVYIAGLAVRNLYQSGSYDIGASSWAVTTTTDTDYDLSDYMDYTTEIEGTDSSEATATSLTTDGYSLMLMPQGVTATDVETWTEDADIDGSYIELLYRMESSDDVDYIGYNQANTHPDYSDSEDVAYDGLPLFIKVGYPVSTNSFTSGEWDMSMNYTYNIKLGTTGATNGYILSEVYYLEDGTATDFAIDYTDKEVGDPISSGEICFDIVVNSWSSATTQSVN